MFKKKHIFFILVVFTVLFAAQSGFAEEEADHTAREEAEGKVIFQKLQLKEAKCDDLEDSDFAALGEYFMGQMVGSAAHPAMNNMITAMHGREGEEQMHIVMGKRLSGCGADAPFDSNFNSKFSGFMPMMGMMNMMGGWSSPSSINNNKFMPMMYGFGNNMTSWAGAGLTFGIVGIILIILWWLFVVAAIVFLIKWIVKQFKGEGGENPLKILKKRYARGEIDKNEFEEKKKELS